MFDFSKSDNDIPCRTEGVNGFDMAKDGLGFTVIPLMPLRY
jgi:hypothetical protein